jgi:hypothetical protein
MANKHSKLFLFRMKNQLFLEEEEGKEDDDDDDDDDNNGDNYNASHQRL